MRNIRYAIQAPAARRPGGGRRPVAIPKPVVPTPPPRSSSLGFGGRYPSSGNSIASNGGNRDSIWSDGGDGRNGGNTRRGQRPGGNNSGNNYNTHVFSDARGNRVWTFSG
uniref:Ddx21 protein n=1 Tax=Fopius arisanus TaxID=64838 RepID=A0A0C9QNM0_9HYME